MIGPDQLTPLPVKDVNRVNRLISPVAHLLWSWRRYVCAAIKPLQLGRCIIVGVREMGVGGDRQSARLEACTHISTISREAEVHLPFVFTRKSKMKVPFFLAGFSRLRNDSRDEER